MLKSCLLLASLLLARPVDAAPGMAVEWGLLMNPPQIITNLNQIALGHLHALGLTDTGSVIGWGSNSVGELTIPFGLAGVTAVAAGYERSYALLNDGTVATWPGFFGLGWDDVTAISARGYQIVGRRSDGTVLASGGFNPPAGLADVTAVAAGADHAAALTSAGTVVVWGDNSSGQLDVPAGLSGVTAIAAGDYHTLALLGNGTVVAWGAGLTQASYPNLDQAMVPAGLSGVTAIAGGGFHSLALKSDGSIVAWGDNSDGQTQPPATLRGPVQIAAGSSTSAAIAPAVPSIRMFHGTRRLLDGIRQDFGAVNPAASVTRTLVIVNYGTANLTGLAVTKDGLDAARFTVSALTATTLAPGASTAFTVTFQPNATAAYGAALHIASNDVDHTPFDINLTGRTPLGAVSWPLDRLGARAVPPGLADLIAVTAGDFFAAGLRSDGRVIVWGGGEPEVSPTPGVWYLKDLDNSVASGVTQIALGGRGGIYLKSDGSVGLLNGYLAATNNNLLAAGSGTLAVAAGVEHYLTMSSDGSIQGWGSNWAGEIDVPGGTWGALAMAAGYQFSAAVLNDGRVLAWGSNSHGQTAVPAGLSGVVDVACGWAHTVALKGDGTVVAWGNNSRGQTTVPAGLSGVVAVEADAEISVALKTDGSVVVWGSVASVPSNLGRPAAAAPGMNLVVALVPPTPAIAVTLDGVVQRDGGHSPFGWVAMGASRVQSCTLSNTGGVTLSGLALGLSGAHAAHYSVGSLPATTLAPGSNMTLQLTYAPTAIGAHPATLQIASNDPDENPFDIALTGRTPMAVNVWGQSTSGQTDLPPGLTDIIALAGGYNHCLALRANGSVVAWGENGSGQATVPAGLTGVKAIAAGWYHSLALKTDGTIVGWGSNGYLQLAIPAGLGPVKAIAAGGWHSLALMTDGTVTAWGLNTKGQTTVSPGLTGGLAVAAGYQHSLVLFDDSIGRVAITAFGSNEFNQGPSDLIGAKAIATGDYHSLALLPDDTVRAWGRNTANPPSVPAGLGSVMAIAGGGYHSLALKTDGTLATWGQTLFGLSTLPAGLGLVGGIAAGGFHTMALVAPAPEIAVACGINRTSDGGTVGFGTSSTGSSDVRTFTITNRGAADLTGLALTKSGPDAGDFALGALSANTLVPGASASFTITFQTSVASNRAAALQIASNDTDESPYDLALTGTTTLTPLEAWRQQWFGSPANTGDGWNELDSYADGDGVLNFVEFAFGTDPTSRQSGANPLRYAGSLAGGGTFVSAGQPTIVAERVGASVTLRALFVRHKAAAAAGLTYFPQFSTRLGTWTTSATAPSVLATGGDWEMVSLPFPDLGGETARFFRVRLTLEP